MHKCTSNFDPLVVLEGDMNLGEENQGPGPNQPDFYIFNHMVLGTAIDTLARRR